MSRLISVCGTLIIYSGCVNLLNSQARRPWFDRPWNLTSKIQTSIWDSIIKVHFLILQLNMYCGYPKEPSQRDDSFEHPINMLKLSLFTVGHLWDITHPSKFTWYRNKVSKHGQRMVGWRFYWGKILIILFVIWLERIQSPDWPNFVFINLYVYLETGLNWSTS